jgi:excisionase family DNA binding protein
MACYYVVTGCDGRGGWKERYGSGWGWAFTVKEVAAILRVCTATVYAMVERGELRHVRVRNAIRIVVAASETALDGRPEPR